MNYGELLKLQEEFRRAHISLESSDSDSSYKGNIEESSEHSEPKMINALNIINKKVILIVI